MNRKEVQEIRNQREQRFSGRKGTGESKNLDEIQLSEKVKLINRLKEDLSVHGDMDKEKIERIKLLIKSGKYRVSSELIAEKILEDEFGL